MSKSLPVRQAGKVQIKTKIQITKILNINSFVIHLAFEL